MLSHWFWTCFSSKLSTSQAPALQQEHSPVFLLLTLLTGQGDHSCPAGHWVLLWLLSLLWFRLFLLPVFKFISHSSTVSANFIQWHSQLKLYFSLRCHLFKTSVSVFRVPVCPFIALLFSLESLKISMALTCFLILLSLGVSPLIAYMGALAALSWFFTCGKGFLVSKHQGESSSCLLDSFYLKL